MDVALFFIIVVVLVVVFALLLHSAFKMSKSKKKPDLATKLYQKYLKKEED
jgi:hypothetical protein